METTLQFSTRTQNYEQLEARFGNGHNRRLINGKTTGCGNCVGYCRFAGHPGFINDRQRNAHQCVARDCLYYVAKPVRIRNIPAQKSLSNQLMALAKEAVSGMEGLRVLRVARDEAAWLLKYVTISNEYSLESIETNLTRNCGVPVHFQRMDYDFDLCAKLIMEG